MWDEHVLGGGVNALAGVGSRVFAAGFLYKFGGVPDVTVRAYEVSDSWMAIVTRTAT